MAPQLTDAQRRTDEAFDQYMARWNLLNPAQKASPDGAQLRDLIMNLARQRNGDEGANAIGQVLNPAIAPLSGQELRRRLDDRFPRTDGGPAPAVPAAPAAPAENTFDGTTSPIYTAEPGDGRVWLPGNARLPQMSDADAAALLERDGQIEAINQSLFGVDPALAWRPDGAQLPVTGSNISTLGDTYNQAGELLSKFGTAVAALNTVFDAGSQEPLIAEQRERMRTAIAALATAAAGGMELPGALAAGAIAANDSFHQLRGQNLDLRREMAEKVDQTIGAAKRALAPTGAILTSASLNGAFTTLPAVQAPSRLDGVAAAAAQIKALTGKVTTPATVGKQDVTAAPAGNRASAGNGAGAANGAGGGLGGAFPAALPGTGPAVAPAAVEGAGAQTKGFNPDDLSKLLAQLSSTAAPLAQLSSTAAPLAQQAAALPQQLAGLPQQLAGLPQQAANAVQRAAQTPNQLLRQLRGDDPENAKLTAAEQAAADGAKQDRAAATTAAYTPPKPAEAAALGAPGSPARPHQLDATGKPVDRNGDGKVDDNAVPLSKKSVKPFDLSVRADGQNVQVKGVPDPRIGEMMLDMADAKGGSPVSVLDAAKAAGMDIPALGDPMDPKLAKVGDAVIGDAQSGIYLGDDKVLTSTGLVENLQDVLGKDGFVSQIPLPELPDTAPGGEGKDPSTVTVGDTKPQGPAPAGGPATQLASTPPPAAPAPAVPPAAPAPAPAPVPDAPAPAPAPAPVAVTPPAAPAPAVVPAAAATPAAPGGGLPKKVPYEGHALG